LAEILGKSHGEVRTLVESIDHIEADRVTWQEFVSWLIKEGVIRNIANDQRLFPFTLCRIRETRACKLGQYHVARMDHVDVDHPSGKVQHLYLVIHEEHSTMHLVDEVNLGKPVYTFDFNSTYTRPKPLEAFPGLKELKVQQIQSMISQTVKSPMILKKATTIRSGRDDFFERADDDG